MISGASRAILPGLVFRTFALAALALAAGCSTPCQDLGDRVCGCQPAGAIRDACERAVKSEVNNASPTKDQQSYCNALLKTCPNPDSDPDACDKMKTEAGKIACGLAYECVVDTDCATGKTCQAGRCLQPAP